MTPLPKVHTDVADKCEQGNETFPDYSRCLIKINRKGKFQ